MYIAPGQGQTASRGQSFDVNINVLSIHSFVVNILLKSDFICFFMIYYMYIAPGQVGGWGGGAGDYTAPMEQSFDVNRNFLSLRSSVASFKS